MFGKSFVLSVAFTQLWLAPFCNALFLHQHSAAKAQAEAHAPGEPQATELQAEAQAKAQDEAQTQAKVHAGHAQDATQGEEAQAQAQADLERRHEHTPGAHSTRPLWMSKLWQSKFEAEAPAQAELEARVEAQVQEEISRSRNASNEEWEEGVAVFVPGFGLKDREQNLLSNIAWLKQQSVPFECTIYVYKSETDLPMDSTQFAPCTLIRHSGMWMDHIRDFSLARTRKKWILHLLDSVQAQPDLNLNGFLHLMQVNHLGHATPTRHRNKSKPEKPWRCGNHQISSKKHRIGRFVSALELQLDVFSRGYFDCMQRLISPENPTGWGMDLVMPVVCGGGAAGFAPHGRMGVFDHMTIKKVSKGSYDRRLAESNMDKFLKKYPQNKWEPYCNKTGMNLGELSDPDESWFW